jgi:negative regulator of flagellin synthesis FlgM
MKIGHPADKPLPPAHASGTPGTPAAQASEVGKAAAAAHSAAAAHVAAATVDASATVALSSTASSLLSGGASADFDADKVARISAQIADGSFKINPEAIADKLIANAQELLTKVKG